MAITAEDRAAITESISLHGHLMNDGGLDGRDQLCSSEIIDDFGDFGVGSLEGRSAIRDAALAMGGANPVGHHITNAILIEIDANQGCARPKGIGVKADGTCGSDIYGT